MRSRSASRWRSTVASSPRAIGPGERAARRRAPPSSRPWPARAGRARARSRPAVGADALGGALERHQEVGGDARRRRGRRRGRSSATVDGVHPEALGELARPWRAPAASSRRRRAGAGEDVGRAAPGTVISGCSEKASWPADERLERRGAGAVADERAGGDRGGRCGDRARPGRRAGRRPAPRAAAPRPSGAVDVATRSAASQGGAQAAGADDGDLT